MLQGRGQRARIGAVAVVAVSETLRGWVANEISVPSGACICARPPVAECTPWSRNGLSRQASSSSRLILVPGFSNSSRKSGEPDALQEHVAIIHRIGIDRHQIVQPVGLDAMAGVIEQRDVGTDQVVAELGERFVKTFVVEVEPGAAADHEEAERRTACPTSAWCRSGGWGCRRGWPIGRIADHQRHALFGMRGLAP